MILPGSNWIIVKKKKFNAKAYHIDHDTRVFINEYNTIKYSKYKTTNLNLKDITSYPSNKGMFVGIGLQDHFSAGIYNNLLGYV